MARVRDGFENCVVCKSELLPDEYEYCAECESQYNLNIPEHGPEPKQERPDKPSY